MTMMTMDESKFVEALIAKLGDLKYVYRPDIRDLDYMLAFLFLRYLSDNCEKAAKKELGPDIRLHQTAFATLRPQASQALADNKTNQL
jgi:hypothetical protein